MEEKYGDEAHSTDPTFINGPGYHLDVSQTSFACPICTCEQDISDKIWRAKFPFFRFKCAGCKRWLRAVIQMNGILNVYEIIKK